VKADWFVVDAGYQSPPAATPVTLHYTVKDIGQLNSEMERRIVFTTRTLFVSDIVSSIGSYVGLLRLTVTKKTKLSKTG